MLNIYRASAGSGKTYRLTKEYIHLLLAPEAERTHRRILAVTFTNKATEEMKSRILHELHALSLGAPSDFRKDLMESYRLSESGLNERAKKVLVGILHDYSAFSISTIDSFFQQVVRAFAREIGVNGGYNIEVENQHTLEQAVDHLFLALSERENRRLLQWLTQLAEERVEQAESWNMRAGILKLGEEIFKENFQYKAEETNRQLRDHKFLDGYRRELRAIKMRFEQRVREAASEALQLIALYGLSPTDFKGGKNSPMKKLEQMRRGVFDRVERLISWASDVEACYSKSAKKEVVETIREVYANGLGQCLGRLAGYFTDELSLYNSANIVLKHLSTLGIMADLAMQIRALTEEQNAMLISDTNMLLNRIIDNSDTPFIYERTGIRVEHYMIDEFQDTSVLQWKNFRPLLADSMAAGRFNLLVGDVKQSIYRWRNSDWKLLDSEVQRDFLPEQLREENLGTNWRSDRCIVAFNNAFFQRAAQALQAQLDANMAAAFPPGKIPEELRGRIVRAYLHLSQATSPGASEGHVRFDFIESDGRSTDWKRECLRRLPAWLEELQDRGYRPSDITILVRLNSQEKEVVDYLLHHKTTSLARAGYCYDVVGNEGLRVASATSVRFLLGVLRLIMRPDDSMQRAATCYEYMRGRRGLSESEALEACFAMENQHGAFPFSFMDEAEQKTLSAVRHRALFTMVEELVALFDLGEWEAGPVFIQAFQDIVLKFSSGRSNDLHSFLSWWDKNGERQNVPSPQGSRAVRIMTIHKSKGLDFPVVLIPFCDWEFDRRKGILWCEPQKKPFDKFPLLPLEYSERLGHSVFAAEYYHEQMHQYIDNLNMAYVAFTRAKHELICMLPSPKKESGEAEKIRSLSGLLHLCFRGKSFEVDGGECLAEHYDAAAHRFEMGNPTLAPCQHRTPAEEAVPLTHYPVVDPSGRLRVRHMGVDFWLEGQQLADSALNYGTIMHRLLQSVRHRHDVEGALRECRLNGLLSEEDLPLVHAMFERFWQLPHVDEWFAPEAKVLNETTILTPDGSHYRPDRVVLQEGEATVVDYKFGNNEHPSHVDQVLRYMELVEQMGYRARGFLCYISLGRVKEVNR